MNDAFALVGIRPQPVVLPPKKAKWYQGRPILSMVLLAVIVLGCLVCELVMTKDPTYMDLQNSAVAPCAEFLFGTDSMGRDIFSMIWHGGRLSLFIGVTAAAVSTVLGVVFGAVSGCAPGWLDAALMRLTEIWLSVPSLLLTVLLQAALGRASPLSLALVIGASDWTAIAKVVRTEVRQLRNSEYILAAKSMGGGFFYLLRRHLAPNFIPSILFMVVMNVRTAIAAESTLSFMGLGLPLETVTWGSMLSLSEKALLSGAWWIILIPGGFLTVTLLCVTSLGDYLRKSASRRERDL